MELTSGLCTDLLRTFLACLVPSPDSPFLSPHLSTPSPCMTQVSSVIFFKSVSCHISVEPCRTGKGLCLAGD